MQKNRKVLCTAAGSAAIVLLASHALAHHGAITNPALYLTENFIELEGEIVDVLWRNPHARARMRVVDADGVEKVWELELGPNPRDSNGEE